MKLTLWPLQWCSCEDIHDMELAASGLTAAWYSEGPRGPCSCTTASPCTQTGLVNDYLPCLYVPDQLRCLLPPAGWKPPTKPFSSRPSSQLQRQLR